MFDGSFLFEPVAVALPLLSAIDTDTAAAMAMLYCFQMRKRGWLVAVGGRHDQRSQLNLSIEECKEREALLIVPGRGRKCGVCERFQTCQRPRPKLLNLSDRRTSSIALPFALLPSLFPLIVHKQAQGSKDMLSRRFCSS